ncbi:hypothetical protein AB0B06_10790 [Streptomyces sp. NPDC044989]|uniref:hypothetical protein n=1 Tax=Streptomyces sp. NPDC044989 TaxID=3154336 RepID=UPI0034054255
MDEMRVAGLAGVRTQSILVVLFDGVQRRQWEAATCAPVEHGFAHLKNRRILAKLRTDPAHATQLLRALLVLTNLEVNR